MKLSIENNGIFLSEIDDLKKYQLSQLEYYGYRIIQGRVIKDTSVPEPEVLKLLDYFKEEEIDIDINDDTKGKIDQYINEKKEISDLFRLGTCIKNGEIDSSDFLSFTNFTDKLPRKLKQHQLKSAYHLYSLKNAANFSVPGSGKTSVVLSAYEKLKEEKQCNVLFVIGPPSCFQPWRSEFHDTLGRIPDTIILSGGDKESRKSEYYRSPANSHELYLATFQTALNDFTEIIKFLAQKGILAFVVIDEAHYIKQIAGSWSKALMSIGKHAIFKSVLTGTPTPKNYKDIFNLFDFLWEENSPLSESDKIQINIWEKEKQNLEAKQLLQEKIGPVFYRVRKKDLGLKPAVFHEPIVIDMNTYEQKIYRYAIAKAMDLSEKDYFSNDEILHKLWRGRMIRLRQSTSYPKLLLSVIEEYSETFLQDSELKTIIKNYDDLEIPGKLQKLTELVIDLNKRKQKVLIWSNFIGTLELIRSHFLKLNLRCELIYGKTPIRKDDHVQVSDEKTREDIRDEFIDPHSGLDILVANPAACAESISLHKTCFHAIYYDLSYNCAQYIQSLDRIHRVGGSEFKTANYYFLQYKNSVDQDIKKNLETKANKMYDLIEQDYAIYDLDLYEELPDDDIDAYRRLFITK